MIARQIGIVLCRVGAAVLIVQAISSLGYTLPGLLQGALNDVSSVAAVVLLTLGPGFAAVGLWVFAERISNAFGAVEEVKSEEVVTSVDLVRIGTALIGLYLLVTGFTYAVSVEAAHIAMPDIGPDFRSFHDEEAARLLGRRASYVTQLVFGFALLFGRERIAGFIGKAKYAGVQRGPG